ncbi:polysaccharide lyase 6 family protein [Mariniphaga sediminis]|uniref:polysaccharide lyase 6 family protein n=1 Tax=Mariniphaga sediminis TaxID=1628158 RepID=UPI003565D29A
MKLFFSTLLIFCFSISGFAKKTKVTTAAEINNGFWFEGDTIVLQDGSWLNQSISIKANGSASKPIVLMAETPGNVILSGNSKLAFSGSHIVISGLYFKDGNLSGSDVISFRTSSSSLANNCRVTNCAIENYNPAVNTVDSKWVSIYGENNQVDRCSFINKNNSGTLLVVWLKSGITPNHIIKDNYFGYRNANLDGSGKELNGQEIIRIGDSSTSMQTAGVQVTGNFFERCNGEIEIISNKSGGNLYSNNIFYECKGMLTLRHGNNCVVKGNYFFGNGVSSSGGVRIIGEDHKVYNNYFENLTGTNYRSAICLVRGKENSALNEYFQVKNALVAFNTMVNCSQAFSVNYNSNSSYSMPPIGSVIAHNHVYNTSSSKTNVIVHSNFVDKMDVQWKNNLMNQGYITNLTFTAEQVVTNVDAKMNQAATIPKMYEPGPETGLLDFTTTEYPEIDTDIRGRIRTGQKLPGASQLTGAVTQYIPQRDSVGATYYKITTASKELKKKDKLRAYVSGNQLVVDVPVAGRLMVYDLNGRCVLTTRISAGITRNTIPATGILLVGVITDKGEKSFQKLFI